MKKFFKLIPIVALLLSGCTLEEGLRSVKGWVKANMYEPAKALIDNSGKQKPAEEEKPADQQEPSEQEPDEQQEQPSETEEQKALREAKERAQALLARADEDNYIGDELAELRTLKAALESAIESAEAPADLTNTYDALDEFLKTAKTKAEYEAEQAAALAEAKQAATEFKATVDPDLYEGEELAQLNTLLGQLDDLIENATDPTPISAKVEEIRTFLATAKTKAEYEAERLAEAKQAAQTYLASVDPDLYEGEELAHINGLIEEINGLLTTATSPSQINSKVQELKDYLATAKTKAEYEEERAAALADRKTQRLQEIAFARPNQFRSEEKDALVAAQTAFTAAVNEATTIEEVNAVSLSDFNAAKAAKTNAQYMLDEMYGYRDPSAWLLVNQHAANYTHTAGGNNINSDNVGFDGVGYLMSPVKYQGDFELSMKLSTNSVATSTVGLMFGNYHDRLTGDGIDGYLINYDIASDHQFVQIWYMNNAYQSYGDSVLDYIGGWIYNNDHPGTTLAERFIRVKYNGTTLRIMDDQEYLEFGEDLTVQIDVSLAYNNNYSINPESKTYSFGFLNWDGYGLDGVRGVIVNELTTANVTNSRQTAKDIAIREKAKLDLSLYEEDEQNQFNAKIAEFEALYDNGTYAQIMAKVDEFIYLMQTLKTHEQWENERHPDISVQLLDNIYSGDPTKYTPSNYPDVNTHAFSWTHVQGSHTVTTDGSAGYCMDAAVHTNFTAVIKATGTQETNPYGATWPYSAFIFGANISGNYFTGIEVVLAQDWGFQLYDSMAGANNDPGCFTDQFRGGFATNSEGVTYRLTFVNGILKVYVVNPATSDETQMAGVDSGFVDVTQWNLGARSGHFGIMDWGGATTYELLEFKDL